MLSYFSGIYSTLYSILIFSLGLYFLNYFPESYQSWGLLASNIHYFAFIAVIVLAAQFSRSRLSLLALVWLIFSLSTYGELSTSLFYSQWLEHNTQWLMLTGINIFLLLVLFKDRGLLSLHSIMRILLIVACGIIAYFWLILTSNSFFLNIENTLLKEFIPYTTIIVPLIVANIILAFKSLRERNLIHSALWLSLFVWALKYYQLVSIEWPIILSFLSVYYLLIIIVESYFLAYRDELTNLPSRRAMHQLALSLGRKYSLAMLDIDHFKKFNDTYGHDIGDQVLKLVAAKLAKVKSGGKVFRYGGEEFTVIFPRKEITQVMDELESLRQAIADYQIVIRHPQRKTKQARKGKNKSDSKTISVTISIGVAMREHKNNFDQTLKMADQALYRAKKSGRNNVSC